MRRTRSALVAMAVLALGACGGDEEAAPEVEEIPPMRSVVSMIEPPDTAGYMEGLRKREPGRVVEFEEAELVELGEVACNLQIDHITGSRPDLTVSLTDEMVKRGHPVDLSERVAGDIRNAARGTICEVEYVEA